MKKICKQIILLLVILLILSNISNAEENKEKNNYKAIRLANNGNVWNEKIGANYIGSCNIISEEPENELKATKIGIGGGGALFFPAISPHNPSEMYAISDMGGIYISHNKGQNWERENLYGTVYAATYDPNREGTIYAGGSGVYRSTDNGDSFELIFPRKDDIKARLIRGDYGTQYYMTYSQKYDPYKNIRSILVDPEDSSHIFAMGYSDTEGIVYESTDNGENFNEIFTYSTSRYLSVYSDLNELFYKRETKELFLINSEEILKYNLESKEKSSVYKTNSAIIDAETVYENEKTYFIIIENTYELDNSYTKVYYTNDFVNKTDITSNFTCAAPTSFYDEYCGTVTYKYKFRYVAATSLNNIYVAHATEEETTERGEYWVITGIIRYHDNSTEYIFGVPFKDQETLQTRLWDDYNTEAYGIAVSKQVEEEFLMTTICGLLVAEDNEHIYPRYSSYVEGDFPNCKYTTNGIDEQTTYGVREDPFHKDVMFLLNTDLGLIKSVDNGASWYRTKKGIPTKFHNTVYDLAFDERRENYVYSIWSSRHDVPYSAGNETDEVYGGFAISKDCGETWDVTYSSGLPEHANPVKMSVVYPENSDEVTIYVATYNKGFFVSYDSGKTFEEMNNGIEKVSYKEGENYQYILASDIEVKDGHIYGITALSYYNNSTQTGKLYEYVNGKWNKIELPENTKVPRDIFYHNDILYICGTTSEVWDYKNGLEYNCYGGGVYAYKDGEFTQIFDESICTTGVQFDTRGTMYVSDTNGNIYRKEKDKDYQKIYDSYHYISKGIQISSDDDCIYLASFGGGLLKLENLNSLYDHTCSGGTATCTKKAVCETCGKEYGNLDINNHSSNTTHKINEKSATCSEEGYTGDVVYDCCNKIKENGTNIEKIEHKYDNGKITKEPTKIEEGEKTYTCEICNQTKIEIIPKLKDENTSVKINELDEEAKGKLKGTKLGIGGGGALFEPAISPFNSNEMLVVPDMGGIYISHNKGEHWDRVNLYGTIISATYDPNREGVIYAGGSGLYRSTDYGKTFELIFPRKDDIITRLTHNENGLQYYFTHSGLYDRNKYVKNILIDPEDSNHIFIVCYSYKKGKVFESTDNGENFKEIFAYEKSTSPSIQFDFNELIYKRETKDLFLINDERIIRYNLDTKTQNIEYESELGLADVTSVYEDNKTYFIIIEKTDELNNSDTKVYYTNDFVNKVDITDELISVQPTTFHNNTYGDVTYKYNFSYVSATSLNNIYITNWSYQQSSSIKKYPYTIDGIIRYKNGKAEYLYGNPFKDHNTLSSRAWCDGNTYSLGIAASNQNEDEFIFTTLCGVYYSSDNTHIYPRYSTVTEGSYPNAKYVTSGIDEQATYGVYEDPFHEGVLLLLNTDLGLIRSEDNGKSWTRANNGIPNKWVNTVYDVAFDEKRENYVYSLWSGRHNAPYSAGNETDGRYGGFAISTDGGKTWDVNYSSGLPENTIPVKMSVIYQENSEEVIIYVATFNEGFFVSYDSGKTFEEMNNGIKKINYKEEEKYQYIFASDIEVKEGHIFGITAKTSYNGEIQPGELYEYIDKKWEKIELPVNVRTPKDIFYKDNVLYISGTATAVWDYKNGTDFNNYGGGVYTYKDGQFTQIFDESISTTSVQIDSKGTLYVSDINGHIYRKEKDKDYQKIYDNYFYISKGLQISSDDNYLYLASFGGGLLKLENLNSLYGHTCSGGIATCTEKAICETCGKEYGELDKNNHSKETTHIENAKKATCSKEGYTGDVVYDCCNQVKEKGKNIEKIEHKYDNGKITKEATYEQEGEKTYTCTVCNETKIEIIPKLEKEEHTEHTGGTATCTEKAICETCGKKYGELDKNNHSKETTHIENAKKATCSEEGYTGDVIYDCCNQVKEKGKNIEKIEHKYDNGKITKEATYEQEGEKTYTCTVCNETKIEIIPKLEKEENTVNQNKVNTSSKNETNTSNNNKINIINNKVESNSNNTNDNIAKEKLPYTGKTVSIGLFITTLLLIILAVYSKIKLKKF